jgi:hypothetical protein
MTNAPTAWELNLREKAATVQSDGRAELSWMNSIKFLFALVIGTASA